MTETFEEPLDEDTGEDFERPSRRSRRDDVPDKAVENAGDIPLLPHAGTGKANTITYLKIIRVDGPPGVRGIKGKMPPESTFEDVARRFGNGTYTIIGCNYKHKLLAREDELEISIPGFEPETPVSNPNGGGGGMAPAGFLQLMNLIANMSKHHQETVRGQSERVSSDVQEMASTTLRLLTDFTTQTRDSERAANERAERTQQAFFQTMTQLQNTAHAQQMEMMQRMHERDQGRDINPLQLVEVFMNGLRAAGEMGGGGADMEPWERALAQGTGMLTQLASIANSPAAGVRGGAPAALPAQASASPNPAGPPVSSRPRKRKRKIPLEKAELRKLMRLRGSLRKRGIDLSDFLTQADEHWRTAPESELFDGDDGLDAGEESADAADTPYTTTPEAPPTDPQSGGHQE